MNTHGKVKAAPEPSRSVPLQRIHPDTEINDLKDMISANFEIRNLVLLSKEQALFRSYRLDIPMSQLKSVFNANIWLSGVCVKPYFWAKKI